MEEKNAKNWSSQPSQKSEDSEPASRVGSLGTIPVLSSEPESHKIGTCGKNCDESNSVIAGEQPLNGIGGKLVRQLVNETEKQLAYHEEQSEYHNQQAELLKQRLEELKQIPENLTDIEQIE